MNIFENVKPYKINKVQSLFSKITFSCMAVEYDKVSFVRVYINHENW